MRQIAAPLVAIILGTFMVVLDTTVVNVAVPSLAKSFNSNLHTLQWVLTGYLLAQAAVIPLDAALAGFSAWITGRKRFHGGDRVRLPVVEAADGKLKFNPLANWSKTDLDAYAAAHDLPEHPLVAFGYPSIGCWPCTSPVEAGSDVRSGRWAGSQKTECGIHTARAPGAAPFVGGDI